MNIGPMLNLYPDSLGGTLDDVVDFLKTEEAEGAFSSCYILPSLYHADLDRGFSVIDYSLNKMYASGETLEAIKKLGIELKLDFILNHACRSNSRISLQKGKNRSTRISSLIGMNSGRTAEK